MPEGPADTILSRIHREIPACVPRHGVRWAQYLLSWEPALEDDTGAVRRRLRSLRGELRREHGLAPSPSGQVPWDRRIRLEHFWFLYEKRYIDTEAHSFRVQRYLEDMRADFGGVDAACLWQSYPRLGLDHRNQFDYYRDLPGGLDEVSRIVDTLHAAGVRAFLVYNPWDTGTRREPDADADADALASLLARTDADGVFLDSIRSADPALLETVKAVRPDIAVCPEMLPLLGDLPSLTGGWQQFAHPAPPAVLAHRWLDPSFCLRYIDRYSRPRAEQIAVAFLHGVGHVVWENVFGWWNPWGDADRLLLKRTTAILRAFDPFFRDWDWEPCVATKCPAVHAMEWHRGNETLFTLLNASAGRPEKVEIEIPEGSSVELSDIWGARRLKRVAGGRAFTCELAPGGVGCVLLGSPPSSFTLPSDAGSGERHRPVTLAAYTPRPAATPAPTRAGAPRRDMVAIPCGRYVMRVRRAVDPAMEGGTYADVSGPMAKEVPDQLFWMDDYQIDRTPVTRGMFALFLDGTRYAPPSLDRFLDDWIRPPGTEEAPWRWRPPEGTEDHPVVWVSLDDARAYASWAGVRLPTEAEWQRAAEGPEGFAWPWGDTFDPERCNGDSPSTTSVLAHPAGASAWGCLDMSGNAWEWTESERDDGHMRYVMVRGGSHLRVSGSIWYTASGAQPCGVHEKVPLLGGGIDRLATVGFRCASATPLTL
jgi:formylglycine-generating enzyme required for sulfatase activity